MFGSFSLRPAGSSAHRVKAMTIWVAERRPDGATETSSAAMQPSVAVAGTSTNMALHPNEKG